MSNHKKAVLLINLGSPDSCEVKDVRRYLKQFLLDPFVIDLPYLLRQLVVRCFILPFRPKKSAEAYASIWTKEGSPLIVSSKKLQSLLQDKLDYPVCLGMRYGNPSIESAFVELTEKNPGLEEIFVIPLYPHYAMASSRTVIEEVERIQKKHYPKLTLKFHPPFFQDKGYLQALSSSMKPYLEKDYDHILFSYHGIPVRHLKKQDPTKQHCYQVKDCCHQGSEAHQTCYKHQVTKTTELLADDLGILKDKWSLSFQSRLGTDQWLEPYTDYELKRLPQEGKTKLLIISPAFVSDCLETIEELGEEGKEIFMEHGGKDYTLIPCLNESEDWINYLADSSKEALA